jgi:hypothetical protein
MRAVPGDGRIVLEGMTGLVTEVLRELPGFLGADQPDVVRKRLYPDPCDDEEAAAEWRRTQHPELFALLANAKQIVERDLPSIRPDLQPRTWRMEIPTAHLPAWISALNAARLTLGALNDVTAVDMDPDREPAYDERGIAILRIDLYAWVQSTLIHVVAPDAGDEA